MPMFDRWRSAESQLDNEEINKENKSRGGTYRHALLVNCVDMKDHLSFDG